MDNNIIDRIVELGRQVWSLLTEDEHENYYIEGTFTFVEDIVALLCISHLDWDDVNLVESIHDRIFD